MDGSTATPSAQLLEANRRLCQLQAQARLQRKENGASAEKVSRAGILPWESAASAPEPAKMTGTVAVLPAHLGWESGAVTAVIRRRDQQEVGCIEGGSDWLARLTDLCQTEPQE
ncbi:MAG: hypothetical protein GY805_20860, partial [Chloroflexi bacterium]|nr:hypothetical protein [Chloroflexota bacterium]